MVPQQTQSLLSLHSLLIRRYKYRIYSLDSAARQTLSTHWLWVWPDKKVRTVGRKMLCLSAVTLIIDMKLPQMYRGNVGSTFLIKSSVYSS